MSQRALLVGLIGLWISSMVFGPVVLFSIQEDKPSMVLNAGEEEPINPNTQDQLKDELIAGEYRFGWCPAGEETVMSHTYLSESFPEVTREVGSPPPEPHLRSGQA